MHVLKQSTSMLVLGVRTWKGITTTAFSWREQFSTLFSKDAESLLSDFEIGSLEHPSFVPLESTSLRLCQKGALAALVPKESSSLHSCLRRALQYAFINPC